MSTFGDFVQESSGGGKKTRRPDGNPEVSANESETEEYDRIGESVVRGRCDWGEVGKEAGPSLRLWSGWSVRYQKLPVIRTGDGRGCGFQIPHFEEDEDFLGSSEPAFFRIVSFPDEAALTVCCSIERLIFVLRFCAKTNVETEPERSVFTLREVGRRRDERKRKEEGNKKKKENIGRPGPHLFQGSNFYRLRLFRRDVPFPFLRGRRRRSCPSRLLLRGLHALDLPLSHYDPLPSRFFFR